MTTLGHVRSWRTIGTYGLYLLNCIFFGCVGCGGMTGFLEEDSADGGDRGEEIGRKNEEPPGRWRGVRASAKNAALALHKQKEVASGGHRRSVCP